MGFCIYCFRDGVQGGQQAHRECSTLSSSAALSMESRLARAQVAELLIRGVEAGASSKDALFGAILSELVEMRVELKKAGRGRP